MTSLYSDEMSIPVLVLCLGVHGLSAFAVLVDRAEDECRFPLVLLGHETRRETT